WGTLTYLGRHGYLIRPPVRAPGWALLLPPGVGPPFRPDQKVKLDKSEARSTHTFANNANGWGTGQRVFDLHHHDLRQGIEWLPGRTGRWPAHPPRSLHQHARPEVDTGRESHRPQSLRPRPGAGTGRPHPGGQGPGQEDRAAARTLGVGTLSHSAPQGHRPPLRLPVFHAAAHLRKPPPPRPPRRA